MKEREDGAKDKKVQYVPAVDGGWGWVVVLGSFFIHVFTDGIVYSFGLPLEILMKFQEFNASNAKASVIISLLTGLNLGMGPIASAITNKYGCRVTTILGSLIAVAGCAVSCYANSVEYLMVSVGCVMGVGFGLMYCPAIVIVTMYFEKKRSMATGIAVCGAGVGTVLFAPISKALVKSSWRMVFAVYAGVLLLCSVCGATFRPLTFFAIDDERREKKVLNGGVENGSIEVDKKDGPLPTNLHQQSVADASERNEKVERSISLKSDKPPRRSRGISESTGFITVKDVFYTSSVSELPGVECHRSLSTLSVKDSQETAINQEEKEKTSRAREIFRIVKKMTDISLLANPIILLYAVSNLLTCIAFNSPLVFLPSHATNIGVTPEQSAYIIGAFGFTNTIGRILTGLISDHELPCKYGKNTARNRLWIYISSLVLCGLLTGGVVFCSGYITLTIYSGLFGLTISSYVCLTSVLLVDLIGIEKLTNAFGLILLFQGIGTVIGPPVSGQIADITGSYGMSFVFCGGALLISGLMLAFIPQMQQERTVSVA